jgi:hypothetical protein
MTDVITDGAVAAGAQLGASAADEWSALVTTAVMGTDRRTPPPPAPGWDAWASSTDPAVAVLDRAAAVVAARRAGACPAVAPQGLLPPAPPDPRPACPQACGAHLARILGGEHEILLAEWLERCEAAELQLPWALLPTLLLKARRQPHLDVLVRRIAGGRAAWLAEAVPELGVAVAPPPPKPDAVPFRSPQRPDDSGAVVAAIVTLFADESATWNTTQQLTLLAASIDPAWLPPLVADLSRLRFNVTTERTRAAVLGLAEHRHAMVQSFEHARTHPRPDGPSHPEST